MDAIKGDKTVTQLVMEYNVAGSLVSKWKKQLIDNAVSAFVSNNKPQPANNKEQQLYEQIGKLSMEVSYLKKFASSYH